MSSKNITNVVVPGVTTNASLKRSRAKRSHLTQKRIQTIFLRDKPRIQMSFMRGKLGSMMSMMVLDQQPTNPYNSGALFSM